MLGAPGVYTTETLMTGPVGQLTPHDRDTEGQVTGDEVGTVTPLVL